MLSTGTLRHKIELQEDTGVEDSYGEIQEQWTTYASPKAAIRPLRGTELMIAQQVQDNVTHAIRLHHRTDVTAEHRIKYGSRTFAILGVLNVEELGIETELACVEQP